ncbi:hypothetical protein EJB05_23154, partial [Eragrostis curvula]
MQRPRRSRRSTRPYSSVSAEEPCSSRGWLSARRKPSKRARPIADGTPLTDEILVGIFAGLPDLADLVRCAGTCRRWRRLVSSEAAFICRGASLRRTRGFFLRGLALGFFHTHRRGAAPRFAPTASASRRLGLRQPSSLNALVDGLDDGLFDSSRLVASRNGLLVVELRHKKHVLKLCVCNPMTGEVTVLPPLSGKDSLGDYACTVLTADDSDTTDQSCSISSWYRLLIVYRRQSFAACRTYSSDDSAWGPEAEVNVPSVITANQMTAMTSTGVVVGNTVYWHTKNQVFVLCLITLKAHFMNMPQTGHDPIGNAMLGVSPDGRLRALQVMVHVTFPSITVTERGAAISVSTMAATDRKWEPDQEVIPVAQWLSAEATHVRLRWVCEKSGVVFFSAGCDDRTSDMYALNLDKKEVEMVARHQHGGRDPLWCNLHGYEMDLMLYLSSLGMDEDYS